MMIVSLNVGTRENINIVNMSNDTFMFSISHGNGSNQLFISKEQLLEIPKKIRELLDMIRIEKEQSIAHKSEC